MKVVSVVLEWLFKPPDYFKEALMVCRDDYTMVIDNGRVEATISAGVYDANPSMSDALQKALNARFFAIQMSSHTPYELSRPSMVRLHEDGSRDPFRELTGEERKSLADLVSSHSDDELLGALLTSGRNSVRDPDKELVHLYEIGEALSARFGNTTDTRSLLGISDADWSRFGQLCNDEPLRQGRHLGKSTDTLRDATHHELGEARDIARSMIGDYLRTLEASSGEDAPGPSRA